jgi:hypothetical protein
MVLSLVFVFASSREKYQLQLESASQLPGSGPANFSFMAKPIGQQAAEPVHPGSALSMTQPELPLQLTGFGVKGKTASLMQFVCLHALGHAGPVPEKAIVHEAFAALKAPCSSYFLETCKKRAPANA